MEWRRRVIPTKQLEGQGTLKKDPKCNDRLKDQRGEEINIRMKASGRGRGGKGTDHDEDRLPPIGEQELISSLTSPFAPAELFTFTSSVNPTLRSLEPLFPLHI